MGTGRESSPAFFLCATAAHHRTAFVGSDAQTVRAAEHGPHSGPYDGPDARSECSPLHASVRGSPGTCRASGTRNPPPRDREVMTGPFSTRGSSGRYVDRFPARAGRDRPGDIIGGRVVGFPGSRGEEAADLSELRGCVHRFWHRPSRAFVFARSEGSARIRWRTLAGSFSRGRNVLIDLWVGFVKN